MENTNFLSCSNEELMKIFNELNKELIGRSHNYEFFHIHLHNRRYRQNCVIENDFFDQIKKIYHDKGSLDIDIRLDPIIVKLIKLFHSDTYIVRTMVVPLNKKPDLRIYDDGEYLNEILDLQDTNEIFVPKNLCKNIVKADEFVEKVKMISWNGIVETYKEWDEEWIDYTRGKGYHRTYEQNKINKNNISIKGKILALAIFDMDINLIKELVELHGDDKHTLCQAIIDMHELVQGGLIK